jgi:hypothetical protein
MGQVFLIIELLLKLSRLWDQFAIYVERRKRQENEEKRKRREKAVDDSKGAQTDDEIWKSQDGIVDNLP